MVSTQIIYMTEHTVERYIQLYKYTATSVNSSSSRAVLGGFFIFPPCLIDKGPDGGFITTALDCLSSVDTDMTISVKRYFDEVSLGQRSPFYLLTQLSLKVAESA